MRLPGEAQAGNERGGEVKMRTSELAKIMVAQGRLTANEGHEIPKASVAKRRLELQRMGYIEAVGEQSRIPSGAKGLIWRLTSAGERAAY